MGPQKLRLWNNFCQAHRIAVRSVPLFATYDGLSVETFAYGRDGRQMLRRSQAMEAALIEAVQECSNAPHGAAEGILYMMHRLGPSGVVEPLYIGRAGRVGRNGGVSANIASIAANTGKFARWGYNYAYHIGDLSAATLPGHSPTKSTPKYQHWARALFEEAPTANPRLRSDVRFWWREYASRWAITDANALLLARRQLPP